MPEIRERAPRQVDGLIVSLERPSRVPRIFGKVALEPQISFLTRDKTKNFCRLFFFHLMVSKFPVSLISLRA